MKEEDVLEIIELERRIFDLRLANILLKLAVVGLILLALYLFLNYNSSCGLVDVWFWQLTGQWIGAARG